MQNSFSLYWLLEFIYRRGPLVALVQAYRYGRNRLSGVAVLKPLFLFVDSRIQGLQCFLDSTFDREYGTDTSGVIKLQNFEIKAKSVELATWYEAMSPKIFEQIMAHLDINFGEFQFIDLGSGKGRVLLLASAYGFEKVVGVEFAPELHQIAINNIQIFERRIKKASKIQSVCEDATTFKLPNKPLVLFFFSPFIGKVMQQVLNNISLSFAENPRKIIIAFYGNNKDSIEFIKEMNFQCEELKLRPDRFRFTQYRGFLFISPNPQVIFGAKKLNNNYSSCIFHFSRSRALIMFLGSTSNKRETALLSGFAYFISAYQEPERIVRLVNVLAKGPDQFYIHFDKRIGGQRFKRWKTLIEQECRAENIQIFSEFQCRWASFGVVDATLSAMNYFEDLNYHYFINLTGECYPLKSPRQIWEAFKDQNAGFMTFWKIPYEGWYQGGINRIHNRFFFLPKKGYPYVRIFHIPRFRKKLPCNLKAYGGWSLFCLPKDLVSYVVKFTENNPNVKSFFKRALIPSELFFQTILLNSPFRDRIVNDNKGYVDFEGAHPRILTKDDYPILKKSEKLFARKFNPAVDKEILDIIDKEIMGIKRDT